MFYSYETLEKKCEVFIVDNVDIDLGKYSVFANGQIHVAIYGTIPNNTGRL